MQFLSFIKKQTKHLLLITLFIFFNALIYFSTQNNLDNKIEFAKYSHLKTLQIHYDTWLSNQADLADTIFFQTMHTPQVLSILSEAWKSKNQDERNLLRQKLYNVLDESYIFYKQKGLLQYHFVFPDNSVFLRVHKKEKHSDDLTTIREDFNQVNQTHQIIRGFSEGRTAHALRNVYPIFTKDNIHIGAIEISFPSDLIQQKLNDISGIHSHFLVSKKVFQSKAWTRDDRILLYDQSIENQDYMVSYNKEHRNNKELIGIEKKRIDKIRSDVKNSMAKGEMFSELSITHNKVQFISFYPIKQNVTNEIAAWLVSYDPDEFIQTAILDTYIARIIGFIIILFFLYFLHRIITQNATLKHLLDSYDRNVIYSTTDLNGKITHVSKAFCDISGYSEKELLGRAHNIVRHPDMDSSLFKEMWEAIKTGKSWKGEVKNLRKDGSYYWVDVELQPDYDSDRKIIGYKAIRHNITDSKELEITQKEVIFTMGSMGEIRSKETAAHVKRVAEYTELLAQLLGMKEEEAQILKLASPMHDIGKIAIEDSILHKPGKLDNKEWKVMQTHAQIGYELLRHSQTPLLQTGAIIAQQHHEKYDGTGYPQGLKGDQIHIYGKITAIVDVYDALSSDRVYKKSWPQEKVLQHIQSESGKHFDPYLVELFLANIHLFQEIRKKLAKTEK